VKKARSAVHARPRAATIHDVAKRAGVSTATVSRALATPDLVSDSTRGRVLAAVKATGYTPNVAARNLRARRSMMVLVMVPSITNAFFAEVLRGIDDELVASGYGIMIANLDNKAEREPRYVELAFAGQVDAVLLMSGRIPQGNGKVMTEAGVPIATICVSVGTGLASIMVDDSAGSRHVVDHLVGLGHKSFGYVSGPQGNQNEVGRWQGFCDGLEAAGFDTGKIHYWPGDFSIPAGVEAAYAFLALSPAARPTAVYAVSDTMAIGFMKTVIEGGVRVPDDVSIVGFDGIEFAEFVTPTLTTIQQPRRQIGRMGARTLIKALNEQSKPQSILLDAPLIVRDSTAPPPVRENARGRSRSPVRVAG